MKELREMSFCVDRLAHKTIGIEVHKSVRVVKLSDAEEYFKKIANDSGFWGRSCSRKLDKIQSLQNEVDEYKAFTKWYSGMEQHKIDKAFERFKKERDGKL